MYLDPQTFALDLYRYDPQEKTWHRLEESSVRQQGHGTTTKFIITHQTVTPIPLNTEEGIRVKKQTV